MIGVLVKSALHSGPEFFAPRPDADVPPSRAKRLSLVHTTHITIIVLKRRKSLTNHRKPLILLHFLYPCPVRESSDKPPGKPQNGTDTELIRPRQPPQKKGRCGKSVTTVRGRRPHQNAQNLNVYTFPFTPSFTILRSFSRVQSLNNRL